MENETNIKIAADAFLKKNSIDTEECTDDVCILKKDKSLIEVISKKKIIIEDGRELLT